MNDENHIPKFVKVEKYQLTEFLKRYSEKLSKNENLVAYTCLLSDPVTIFHFIDRPGLNNYFETTIAREWGARKGYKECEPEIRKDLWEEFKGEKHE